MFADRTQTPTQTTKTNMKVSSNLFKTNYFSMKWYTPNRKNQAVQSRYDWNVAVLKKYNH